MSRPPALSSQAVTRLIYKYFYYRHIEEESISSLPSYDDRNFYFRGRLINSQNGSADLDLQEYHLKLTNPLYSSYEVITAVNEVMFHLQSNGCSCIHPIENKQGEYTMQLTKRELLQLEDPGPEDEIVNSNESTDDDDAKNGDLKYPVRVMTYIPGQTFDSVEKKHLTPKLLYEIGKRFGRMDSELKKQFGGNRALITRSLDPFWDLSKFLDMRKYLSRTKDLNRRQMAEKILVGFEESVSPKIEGFQKSVIYGDGSGMNTILKKSEKNDSYELAGLIDFGECSYNCTVFELGILICYTLLENLEPIAHAKDPLEFITPVVSGYVNNFPLSEDELGSLYYLILARCCMSAMSGEIRFESEPWNEYLLHTPEKCWKTIEYLSSISKETVDRTWKSAAAMTEVDFE